MYYAFLIKGFAQRKECHRAMQLYQEMRREQIPVNLVTFNTLIDGCARVGDMEQAASLFTEMCTMDVEPDLITYSTCVKGYCVQGDLEQATQLFSMMRRKGIQPDAILFNSILDGCAKRQMRGLAENVMNDMNTSGIVPSNITLSILVKLYGRCRDLDRAFELVEELSQKHGFQVNTHVYTCLMSACMANGSMDRAKGVFRQMQEKGCVPDAKTYETLVQGCLRSGDMVMAAEVVHAALDHAKEEEKQAAQQQRRGYKGSSYQQANHRGNSKPGGHMLEQELVENVLFMIGRRGLTVELGVPLLEKLKARHFAISERAQAGVMRGFQLEEKLEPTATTVATDKQGNTAKPKTWWGDLAIEEDKSPAGLPSKFLQRRKNASEQHAEEE